jgi:hypothetical protein
VQIYSGFMIGGPPSAALNVLLLLCDNAPNDQALCFLGVQLVEPLLDLHWKEIGSAFETEVRRRPALRKALSCAWLDLNGKAGKDFERRLRTLVGPDDHVGH